MNAKTVLTITAAALFLALGLQAQTTSITASLNKKLGIYVFPAQQQDAAKQAQDEQAAYAWAVEQSGVDPLTMKATEVASVDKGPDGSVVKGAARGALAGVAIGAIAGDAGKGAAIGATGGAAAGGIGKRRADADAEKQAQNAATQTDAQALANFKKAYTVALEGKGYSVK
jgi:hypothetical protein